jgi:hypothetical protein
MADDDKTETKTEDKTEDGNGWSKLETVINGIFDKKAKEYGWQTPDSKTSSETSTETREGKTERKKGFLSDLFSGLDNL